MTGESTIFAAQFSDMFAKFVKQQMDFQKSIEKTLESISNSVEANQKSQTVKNNFLSKADQKYREGRPDPKDVQKSEPRKVVEEIIPVSIKSIDESAAKKLSGDITVNNENNNKSGGGGGLIEKVLGSLLLGVASVAGGFFAKEMGINLGPLKAAFSVGTGLFKKLLKRLPLVGLLISVGEAISSFKEGTPKGYIDGFLSIAEGIAYMFPGLGTAIGIGISLLKYFFDQQFGEEPGQLEEDASFGDIYKHFKTMLQETSIYKWFVGLKDKFLAIFTDPGSESLYEFFDHIGLVWLSDMMNSLDVKIGGMLGLTDEFGEGVSLTEWIQNWIADHIFLPIMTFFENVGGKIADGFNSAVESVTNFVTDYIIQPIKDLFSVISDGIMGVISLVTGMVTESIDYVKQKADELNPVKNVTETFEALGDSASLDQQTKKGYKELIEEETNRIKNLGGEATSRGKEAVTGVFSPNGTVYADEGEREYYLRLIEQRKKLEEENPTKYLKFTDEGVAPIANDFSVYDGEFNAIVRGNKTQRFSKDDTIIGFKDGEALAEGIKQLIEVGQQQLEILTMYLDKSGQSSVIAPSTTNNYSYNVESSVSAFRKAIS